MVALPFDAAVAAPVDAPAAESNRLERLHDDIPPPKPRSVKGAKTITVRRDGVVTEEERKMLEGLRDLSQRAEPAFPELRFRVGPAPATDPNAPTRDMRAGSAQ